MYNSTIEGIDNSQLLLDRFGQLFGSEIKNRSSIIRFELELVDHMAEIMVVIVLEVRNEILNMHVMGLERASVAEVEVSDDLERRRTRLVRL
jgi:hypothetical protein